MTMVSGVAVTLTDKLLAELRQEAPNTRRALERVPGDRLSWRPHEKSMSLGQLAMHIAVLPGAIGELLDVSVREVPQVPLPEVPSVAAILSAFDASIATAQAKVAAWGDARLAETWTLTRGGAPLVSGPRFEMVRAIMLNHWYHHRGQLSVYLRLLGVPVPALYGPSADENPFG